MTARKVCKTIRIPMDKMEKWFCEKLHWLANRTARLPGVDAEDVYHELLVKASEREWPRAETPCRWTGFRLPVHPGMVNVFLNQRAIDIFRREKVRLNRGIVRLTADVPLPILPSNVEALDQYVRHLTRCLAPRDLEIVLLKAFPPTAIVQLAKRDHAAAMLARADGALRMNVLNGPVILDRHIAEYLEVSPATTSRAFNRAREALLTGQFDADASELLWSSTHAYS